MLLGTLGASLLGDLLTKHLSGKRTVRAGEGFLRTAEGIKKKVLMPPHPLTNFEIQMSLDLMVFILEIIYQKQKMEHILLI